MSYSLKLHHVSGLKVCNPPLILKIASLLLLFFEVSRSGSHITMTERPLACVS